MVADEVAAFPNHAPCEGLAWLCCSNPSRTLALHSILPSAEADWNLFGVSIAERVLVFFALLALLDNHSHYDNNYHCYLK